MSIDEQAKATHRVECRVHGGYFWFPLLHTIEDRKACVLIGGKRRVLPIVPKAEFKLWENAINEETINA
jgi:hypothetical protein